MMLGGGRLGAENITIDATLSVYLVFMVSVVILLFFRGIIFSRSCHFVKFIPFELLCFKEEASQLPQVLSMALAYRQ